MPLTVVETVQQPIVKPSVALEPTGPGAYRRLPAARTSSRPSDGAGGDRRGSAKHPGARAQLEQFRLHGLPEVGQELNRRHVLTRLGKPDLSAKRPHGGDFALSGDRLKTSLAPERCHALRPEEEISRQNTN